MSIVKTMPVQTGSDNQGSTVVTLAWVQDEISFNEVKTKISEYFEQVGKNVDHALIKVPNVDGGIGVLIACECIQEHMDFLRSELSEFTDNLHLKSEFLSVAKDLDDHWKAAVSNKGEAQ